MGISYLFITTHICSHPYLQTPVFHDFYKKFLFHIQIFLLQHKLASIQCGIHLKQHFKFMKPIFVYNEYTVFVLFLFIGKMTPPKYLTDTERSAVKKHIRNKKITSADANICRSIINEVGLQLNDNTMNGVRYVIDYSRKVS